MVRGTGRWDFPLLSAWSRRPTLILRRPLIGEVFGTQIWVSGIDTVDSEIEEMIRRKREEWTRRGIRPNLQDMAVELAREWTGRIVEWHLRNLRGVLPEDELRRVGTELTKKMLSEALNTVAERWISAMTA
ncbi:MAG: hypothetical protein QXP81_09350 [Nitrososphaerota archaeon]